MPEPPSYLWQSIVVTVLCCLPLGIPAIIFSTKVKPAYVSGDYQGSLNASKKAKMWCLIALILGLIPLPVGMGSYMMVNVLRDAEEGKVKGDIQTLKASLIRYKTRGGQYPTTEQGLKALVTKPSDGPQPKSYKNLLSEQALYDPWGNLYQYRIPGKRSSEEYDIYSLGRDGQEGTEDDIGNW
jgi:general secretion pathway protein G